MSTALERSNSRIIYELKKQAEAQARLTTLPADSPAHKRCMNSISSRDALISRLKVRIQQLKELEAQTIATPPQAAAQVQTAVRRARFTASTKEQSDKTSLEQMAADRINQATGEIVQQWTSSFNNLIENMITALKTQAPKITDQAGKH